MVVVVGEGGGGDGEGHGGEGRQAGRRAGGPDTCLCEVPLRVLGHKLSLQFGPSCIAKRP